MKTLLFLSLAAGAGLRSSTPVEPPARSAGTPTALTPARRQEVITLIRSLPARITKLGETLQVLDARLERAQLAVPTAEEFRRQVSKARIEIEKLRSRSNERLKDAKRVADARSVKLDAATLKDPVPERLEADADFLRARDRALDEARKLSDLEERLIKVMLTTKFETAVAVTPPDEKALAREWANLATHQMKFGEATRKAIATAAAAKVDFDPADLAKSAGAPAPKGNRAFVEAREQAAIQLAGRDASAELVATLEFQKAAGPMHENW